MGKLRVVTNVRVFAGAASDKVAALEKAGVLVTDSPAKIGSTMFKVCALIYSITLHLAHSSF